MKANRRLMVAALKHLSKLARPKAAPPVLSHVLLESKGGLLTLTATDLEQRLQAQIPAEGEIRTCLPCKLLHQLVKPADKKSGQGEIVLEAAPDNQVAVHIAGMATLLRCSPVADFPGHAASPAEDWHLVGIWPSKSLLEGLIFVLPAVSKDDTRLNLNSVQFESDRIVATDGHRLHLAKLPAVLAEPFLLPSDAAKTLKFILTGSDQVIVARSGDIVRFKAGAYKLDVRLMDERFPDINKVVPKTKDAKIRLEVDPALFSRALDQLAKVASDKHLKMTVNGKLTIEAFDPDTGSAELTVPTLQSTHTGEDLVVGFNAGYLSEAIKKASGAVTVGLVDPLSPARIDHGGNGRVAVVMPLRV